MHEVGIMMETLRLAEQQARASGATRISKVRMRIGQMSGVVPDALNMAFEVLSPDTMAAGAELEIEPITATLWCDGCKTEFPSPDYVFECPRCGTLSGELRRGREMELVSMEVS
jgi:hydrogenase nickel incorporation protein HypA/HybF